MYDIENKGEEIYRLTEKIFPICRSITGKGVRETLSIINEYLSPDNIQFDIKEVPSGTEVFDWTVPKEWDIRSAYIEDESGKKIIDMKDNNLHVLGYSMPIDKWVTLEELRSMVYTQPDQPDLIPYVTSYYKERSGFCMSQKMLDSLPEGKYHVFVDSELFNGSLTYAELILKGKTSEEIMLSSYTCHPSMANNECSGPALLSAIIKYVNTIKDRKYTYRFVLNPETIGALTYLSINSDHLKEHLKAGIVLSCVGDDRDYSVIHSKYADTITDKSLTAILKHKPKCSEYSFLKRGSDERQYNAPGIDLPVIGFCRSKYGEFPEYHTSADNMDIVSPEGFRGSYETLVQWIDCMELNEKYRINVLGEPQLGKRNLYPTISQKGAHNSVMTMRDFIAYADGRNDLFDIAEIIGVDPCELLPIVDQLLDKKLIEV